MSKIKLVFTFALISAAFMTASACSKSSSDNSPSETATRKYQFIENGCDTGEHSFSSSDTTITQQQLCSALQDDALNKGCAYDIRQEAFTKWCSGSSSSSQN